MAKTVGFEVELSCERAGSSGIIPKAFRELKFNNIETSYIKEYITPPILVEDWKRILMLAKNVYYSTLFEFDISNKRGAITVRGESLHCHIPFDEVEGMEAGAIALARNLIPLMGRAFEFRDTISDRAWIEYDLTYDSKYSWITVNSQTANKPPTLEIRINESLLGGWFVGLALLELEDLPISLAVPCTFWELEETEFGFDVVFQDFEGFIDYLRDVCKELEKKYQHNQVVWYFLNRLPKIVATEKKGWERRMLDILFGVKDREFQSLLKSFEKKNYKVLNGWFPKSFGYYITF